MSNSQPRLGARLMQRLEQLAQHTSEPGRMTRLYLSPAHASAAQRMIGWMAECGVEARLDAAGNVVARYEGATPDAPALLLGSHIDTVRDGGRFDGTLGAVAAFVLVEHLAHMGERLPFAVEIVAFGDEEGVRFPTTLSGSHAIAGTFDDNVLNQRDRDGVLMADALRAFGCDPAAISGLSRQKKPPLAFLELHIEQGPVLEQRGLPVGIVTAINGATRLAVEVTGKAGHAGTVPMAMRRDALAASAQMIGMIEALAQAQTDGVATVGSIDVAPGAVNVIPGLVHFSIDVRAPNDHVRKDLVDTICTVMNAAALKRGVTMNIVITHEAGACICDAGLRLRLHKSVARQDLRAMDLPSGAGHDSMVIGALCPVAMLFVRCKGGISHHPDESVTLEDAEAAMQVLLDFVRNFDIEGADSLRARAPVGSFRSTGTRQCL